MLYPVGVPFCHRVEPKDRAFGKAEKLKEEMLRGLRIMEAN
jgi:hypothetical protein